MILKKKKMQSLSLVEFPNNKGRDDDCDDESDSDDDSSEASEGKGPLPWDAHEVLVGVPSL